MLETLRTALAALTDNTYHYVAANNATPPYIVWAEDSDNDLSADNTHAERMYQGTIDLYTNIENDPLIGQIPATLESIGAAYYLSAVLYEDDTMLIHYEWVWEFYG